MERPRSLAAWVQWVVIAACVTTVTVAAVGARELWFLDYEGVGMPEFWFQNGLALALGAWILATAWPQWRLSRVLRVAVLLPVAHGIAMIAAWTWWSTQGKHLPHALVQTPLQQELPFWAVIGSLAFLCGGWGWLVARRRSEWLQAAAMMALSFLLLIGLWLPLACRWWSHSHFTITSEGTRLVLPAHGLIAEALLPPVIAAMVITWFGIRGALHTEKNRVMIGFVVGTLLLAATGTRAGAPIEACVAYANFFHVLLAAGLVAIAGIIALGIASWRHRERGGRIEGVITGDAPIASFQIRSWLRGPTPIVGAFTVSTPHGELPVAPGAGLDMPLPAETLSARLGQSVAVLRGGDRVTLAGYELPDPKDPFRDSHMPQPGPGGISVGQPRPRGFANVALAVWRPCVAYLLILVAVALPALASTLRTPTEQSDSDEEPAGYRLRDKMRQLERRIDGLDHRLSEPFEYHGYSDFQ